MAWEQIGNIRGAPGLPGANGVGAPGKDGTDGEPGLVWRGPYVRNLQYYPDDAVEQDGSSYVCTVATRSKPPSGAWDLLAKRGATGPPGMSRGGGGGGGGGSALTVKDESVTLDTAVASIDFTGAGVTATNAGHAVTVTIPGGGGSGGIDYVQDADPGAVGAKKTWLRTDGAIPGGWGTMRALFVRNDTDDAWIQSGVLHYDASDVLRQAITMTDALTVFALFNASGTLTTEWTLASGASAFRHYADEAHFDVSLYSPFGTFGYRFGYDVATGNALFTYGQATTITGSVDPRTGAGQNGVPGDLFVFNDGIGGTPLLLQKQDAIDPNNWAVIGIQAAFVPDPATPEQLRDALVATGLMAAA